MRIQQHISQKKLKSFIGKTLDVLIDEKPAGEKNLFFGRSEYDAPEVDGLVYVKTKRERVW